MPDRPENEVDPTRVEPAQPQPGQPPAQQAPMKPAPVVQQAPVQQTPVQPAPVQQAPAQPGDGDIDVDLTGGGGGGGLAGLARPFSRPPAPPPKERAAMRIGIILTLIFGIAIFFTIWEGFRVIFFSMDQPDHTKTLVTEAVVPLLEKIATFFTTVFSPLLAFILGYYFGQGQAAQKAEESNKS